MSETFDIIVAAAGHNALAPPLTAHRYTPIGFGPALGERLAGHPQGQIWRLRATCTGARSMKLWAR